MTTRSLFLPDSLYDYMVGVGVREPDVLRRLRDETARLPQAHYQIAPEEGQTLAFLVELIAARRTLDIGTFTGYSALAVALALPAGGTVLALDLSAEFTAIAERAWAEAGIADRIELRLGPALDNLNALIERGESGTYDFAFIDADKESYDAYYEASLTLLRPGGLAAIDNTLWRGRVVDPDDHRAKTETFRAFNRKVHADARVAMTVLPVGDGLTLVRKRG